MSYIIEGLRFQELADGDLFEADVLPNVIFELQAGRKAVVKEDMERVLEAGEHVNLAPEFLVRKVVKE